MVHIRVYDEAGNPTDYESEVLPRIGERILLEYGTGGNPVRPHYFRVKDVMHRLDNGLGHQAAILIEEESDPAPSPA